MSALNNLRWPIPALASLAMLIAFVSVLVPFNPFMPGSGLDASWGLGMNVAAQRGLALGTDIVFTFGALSTLFTHLYEPSNFNLAMVLSSWMAAGLFVAVYLLLRQSTVALVAVAIGLFLVSPSGAVMFFYPFLYYVFISRVEKRSIWFDLLLLFLLVPVVAVILVKGSFILSSLGFLFLAAMELVHRWQIARAVLLGAAAGVMFLVLWHLSGQPLTSIGPYFSTMVPIVSGYTEAMSTSGPVLHLVIYIGASVFVLVALAASHDFEFRSPRLWLDGVAFLLFLFLCFKASFVRHDGHALTAASALSLVTIPLLAILTKTQTARLRDVVTLILTLMVCGYVIQGAYLDPTLSGLAMRTKSTVVSVFDGVAQFTSGKRDLNAAYGRALANIRRDHPLAPLAGSADIYSYDQAQLIAAGADWDPRPVFQSYSAYEPVLAAMNRQHLEGSKAPDNIVFALQTIDGRMPSLDDGASWPVFMSRYRLVDFDGTYAYLRRRGDGAAPLARSDVASRQYRLNESFDIPQTDDVVFAFVRARPSLLGKLVQAIFKIPPLSLNLTMADGSQRTYRTVSGMMDTGFVISPLVTSTADFMRVISGNADILSKQRVKSASISAALPWLPLWSSTVAVELEMLGAERQDLPASMSAKAMQMPDGTPLVRQACNGVIDTIDGTLRDQARLATSPQAISLTGWLASAPDLDGFRPTSS